METLAVGTTIADRYEIVPYHRTTEPNAEPDKAHGTLGGGGMGIVYLARDLLLGRSCAVKTINPEFLNADGDQAIARFLREAEATAGLCHPNIIKIYDVGMHGDLAFFALEFDPWSWPLSIVIAHYHNRGTFLPLSAIRAIFGDALAGLSAMHTAGYLYRDFKPANILVSRPERWRAKLLDLGVVRSSATSQLTRTTAPEPGSIQYQSPEVVAMSRACAQRPEPSREDFLRLKARIDARSDLWAVGVALYETLTNRRPFSGNELAIHEAVCGITPVWPSHYREDVERGEGIEHVCLRLMERDVEKRYGTALEAYLAVKGLDSLGVYELSQVAVAKPELVSGPEVVRGGNTVSEDVNPNMLVMPALPLRLPGFDEVLAAEDRAREVEEGIVPASEVVRDIETPPRGLPRRIKMPLLAGLVAALLLVFVKVMLSDAHKESSAGSAAITAEDVLAPAREVTAKELLDDQRRAQPQVFASSAVRPTNRSAEPPAVTAARKVAPEFGADSKSTSRTKRKRKPRATTAVAKIAPEPADDAPLPDILGNYTLGEPVQDDAKAAAKKDNRPPLPRKLCSARLAYALSSEVTSAPAIAELTKRCGRLSRKVRIEGAARYRLDGADGRVQITFSTLVMPDGERFSIKGIAYASNGTPGLQGVVDHRRDRTSAEVRESSLDVLQQVTEFLPLDKTSGRIVNDQRSDARKLRHGGAVISLRAGLGFKILFSEAR